MADPDDAVAISTIADRIHRLAIGARTASAPLCLGVCGAQGIGKSTVCGIVTRRLRAEGQRVLAFSIDDLYLTRAERLELARNVHPLFAIRGVPGTHDVALGERVVRAATSGSGPIAVPRFDKARDDRAPKAEWPVVVAPVDVVLLEGWCVGAGPQSDAALRSPINALERDEDPDGIWRGHANAQLAGPYHDLFRKLDRLVLLAAPGFDVVAGWRRQQEAELRDRLRAKGSDASHAMSDAEVDRFVLFYERITRHVLSEMPSRADLVLRLDEERRLVER